MSTFIISFYFMSNVQIFALLSSLMASHAEDGKKTLDDEEGKVPEKNGFSLTSEIKVDSKAKKSEPQRHSILRTIKCQLTSAIGTVSSQGKQQKETTSELQQKSQQETSDEKKTTSNATEAEKKPETEIPKKPETEAQKPEVQKKPETETPKKPETEPEIKPETKPEKKSEPEKKPETEPQEKSEPEKKPETEPEKKSEPEKKPETEPEKKLEPEKKTETEPQEKLEKQTTELQDKTDTEKTEANEKIYIDLDELLKKLPKKPSKGQETQTKDIAEFQEKWAKEKAGPSEKKAEPTKKLTKEETPGPRKMSSEKKSAAQDVTKSLEKSSETISGSQKITDPLNIPSKAQTEPAKENDSQPAKELESALPQKQATEPPKPLEKSAKGIAESEKKPVKNISEKKIGKEITEQKSGKKIAEIKPVKETVKPQQNIEKPTDRSQVKRVSDTTKKYMKENVKPDEKPLKELPGPWGNEGQVVKPRKKSLKDTNAPKRRSKGEAKHLRLQLIQSEDEPSGSEVEDMKNFYDDYFDIMIIGKTGLGKTTTADKLLLANLTGKQYGQKQQDDTNKSKASSSQEPSKDGASQRRRSSQASDNIAQAEDLSMWHISDEVGDIDMVEQRLKNLIYCRLSDNPHEAVNKLREDSSVTKCCELLSNDTSKIRILDVPGFFSTKKIGPKSSKDMLENTQSIISNNLLTMRKILHIKTAYQFKFNRIVYFLPERGVLRSNSQVLQMELQMMETYFGRTIFECMLVVATHDRSAYKSFKGDNEQKLYSPLDFEKTKMYLQQALRAVFADITLIPRPPIEFLSYHSTCEDLLNLIKGSKVMRRGVKLAFNTSTCARCHTILKRVKPKIFQREGEHSEHSDMITCRHPDMNEDIPYEDSPCHPMIIPKYSMLQRIFGGIVHVIMPVQYVKRHYPSFKNFEEVCMACGKPPGSLGCKLVNSLYRKKCRSCRNCRNCEYCSVECKKILEWIECSKCKLCKKCQKCSACKEGLVVFHTDKVREKYKVKKDRID